MISEQTTSQTEEQSLGSSSSSITSTTTTTATTRTYDVEMERMRRDYFNHDESIVHLDHAGSTLTSSKCLKKAFEQLFFPNNNDNNNEDETNETNDNDDTLINNNNNNNNTMKYDHNTSKYSSTNVSIDLSKYKPDFIVASLYKWFGYPTGLGILLIRKIRISKINFQPRNNYFAGGNVQKIIY
ncbi:predicted protein [Naegleria gruberi]|uniref:Predicted protein n=1 Tax=Naegleria gruberi TaxID=5762 RepID=D2VXC1_NAEGR|nr:uncharacterized protein NAEGRDRAFT_73693 [Naegleria gruberi]EFC38415.1 predicted protein [Naegleria gruberi]|eukprot:XP_002671159.1 predicted protein [Naegleria gruberi strain NEG-M]